MRRFAISLVLHEFLGIVALLERLDTILGDFDGLARNLLCCRNSFARQLHQFLGELSSFLADCFLVFFIVNSHHFLLLALRTN